MKLTRMEAKMEASGNVRKFYITDEIMEDYEEFNYDTWRWETVESQTSQSYFVKNLEGLTAADSVELYINSMGGSVKEALGIFSALQRCPATVTAYIDGFAASAASVIAMAADRVIMPRNTAMMIHNAAWWTYGNPEELRKSADDLEVINMAAINSYTMHAGDKMPKAVLKKLLDAATWLTAEDCVKYGLADELGGNDWDLSASAKQFAEAKAAATGPMARMFATMPAFLAACKPEADMSIPDTPATGEFVQNGHKKTGTTEPGSDNPSSLTALLKSLINTEENK